MPRASYCVPRCPRTFWDILTRGLKSQLGHRGISPDIPVNCCISKQSHVQHILLCPRMSRDILGLPNKRYAVPARTSRDIQGHPSQLGHCLILAGTLYYFLLVCCLPTRWDIVLLLAGTLLTYSLGHSITPCWDIA